MKIKINLPPDYQHLYNEYYMIFTRSWTDIQYCFDGVEEVHFTVNMVPRHRIPYNATTVAKSVFDEETKTLALEIKIFRIIPSVNLKEAFFKEFKFLIDDCD